jgi:demethylmenaquinone methyltransferase / 2-methoxy-6-polyprenyl-1,4-benzoquinol methylase
LTYLDQKKADSKKEAVTRMFDQISGTYDFLNRLLSLGIDVHWRKKAISMLKIDAPENILDIATGTGDMAVLMVKILHPAKITGIDLSVKMLDIGRKKILKKKLEERIELIEGDSEHIPFESNNFDAVTVAFGVRNFENPEKGLNEMCRVLKKGRKAVIIEFSLPDNKIIKYLYLFYFGKILPFIGRIFSGNVFAYSYLPDSVSNFPQKEKFIELLLKAGFSQADYKPLSSGICTIYTGIK